MLSTIRLIAVYLILPVTVNIATLQFQYDFTDFQGFFFYTLIKLIELSFINHYGKQQMTHKSTYQHSLPGIPVNQ